MRIMVEKCRNGGYNGEAEQTRQAAQRERGKTRGVARIFERGVHTVSNRGLSAPCFLYVTKEACKGGRGGHGHPRTPPLSLRHRRGGG